MTRPLVRLFVGLIVGCGLLLSSAHAETAAQRDARMKWWRDARLGMFIHWGLYAIPAGEWNGKEIPGIGEWIMDSADIPIAEYEKLPAKFNPTAYDPKAWAKAAKEAGVKYVVITSKHHDGFCLFDTDATDWDVVDATPYGKDLLMPLAEACRAEGLKFCTYYSIMDWHHPAQERNPEHYNPTQIKEGQREAYIEYMKKQLAELLDSCNPEVLWFDGEWPEWWREEDGREIYTFLLARKPNLIVNNRVGKERYPQPNIDGEGIKHSGDFGTPEQEIPATGLPGVDWESCMTMNDTWGFKKNDHNWKSTETLIRNLVDIASKGGNYLLNVGPTAEGRIPDESLQRLSEMGDWLATNGESIYATTASPFEKLPWGRATQRVGDSQDEIYLHVFAWPADGKLSIPKHSGKVTSAKLLADGSDLKFESGDEGTTIELPSAAPDPIDTVVKLILAK